MVSSKINFGTQADIFKALNSPDISMDVDVVKIKKNAIKELGGELPYFPIYKEEPSVALLELCDAIRKKDLHQVKSLLANNDQLNSQIAKSRVLIRDVFNFFDCDIANFILNKGVEFKIYDIHNEIIKSQSFEMVKFFIDKYKVDNKKNLDEAKLSEYVKIKNISKKTKFSDIGGFLDIYTPKDLNYWNKVFKFFIYQAQNDNSQKIVDYIKDNIPTVLVHELVREMGLVDFMNSSPKDSKWHIDTLSSLDEKCWSSFFNSSFKLDELYHFDYAESLDVNGLSLLYNLINDNPKIRSVWDKSQNQNQNRHKKWLKWFDQYLPLDLDLDQSAIFKVMPLLDSKVINDNWSDYYTSLLITLKNDLNWYRTADFKNYTKDTYCFSPAEFIRYLSSKSFSGINLKSLPLSDERPNPFHTNPVSYAPPSFMHMIVSKGGSAVLDLIKTQEGRVIVDECLEDKYTQMKFLTVLLPVDFIKTIKALPPPHR